jgi:predicted ArsR family transcriptional regulator
VEIVERLRSSGGPLTAAQLAEALAVHHTVVREHLGVLIDAGMVRSQPLPISGRGRPRTGYLAVAEAEPDVAYRTLAGLLAEMVATGADAREVGRRAALTVQPSAEGAVATMRQEAERLGFNPHVRSKGDVHEIVLRDCPFVAVAVDRPETVCELHLGLAEGVCDLVGGAVVDGLRLADPRKGGCRLVMRTLGAP